ncbi:MAG TPA: hypothetical protein VIU44_00570, partial [Gaiellaceae bacterium]
TRPIMDIFDQHVYGDSSALPPSMPHAGTPLGEGDYGKLVALLGKAFDGTAQRGSKLPIVYGEYGVQTQIPPAKQRVYSGFEQPAVEAVDEATQGRYYAQAIRLAACSPNVRMLLFFHVFDEFQRQRLQTGVYYADGTPKSDLATVAEAAREAESGKVKCAP